MLNAIEFIVYIMCGFIMHGTGLPLLVALFDYRKNL